ncbi:hypothetical protein LJY25_07855 [Hymenobacter sp. BT175]|uniref:hypothetical protein n=1 Tax=Hymenobacter translucens TaxID=2886507 RepID=UPI001D0E2451|nr:hypothetical protein [Hymenobacter translucens]MCC2546355.1 hypothetical protein [Hymenobacter translucens]
MTLYFKRPWYEADSGSLTGGWGTSVWLFETDIEGMALRQIILYANGQHLKYSLQNPDDEYGFLADQALDLGEFEEFRITKDEFDEAWK